MYSFLVSLPLSLHSSFSLVHILVSMKMLMEPFYLNFLIFISSVFDFTECNNNRWGYGGHGGGGGSRWKQGGFNDWRHNNLNSNQNNHNSGNNHNDNFNNNHGNQNNGNWNHQNNHNWNNQDSNNGNGHQASFGHTPSEAGCAVPSIGDSGKFELRCTAPGAQHDVECAAGDALVSGTSAVLKCKAPYVNEDGDMRTWVCKDGTWKGTFKPFRCSYKQTELNTNSNGNGHNKPLTPSSNTSNHQGQGGWQSNNNAGWSNQNQQNGWTAPSTNNNNNNHKPVENKPNAGVDNIFPGVFDDSEDNDNGGQTIPPASKPAPVPTAPITTPAKPNTNTNTNISTFDWEKYLEELDRTTTTTSTTTTTPKPQVPSQDLGNKGIKCPSLSKKLGVQLDCLSKTPVPWDPTSFIVSQSNCSTPQAVGADATYKCQQYFESTAGLTIQYRKCKEDGTWTGGAENGFSCFLECGKSNPVGKIPLITNGEPTFKDQWPWHASLFFREVRVDPNQHAYICGGTLISKRAVISAAHCVTERFSHSTKPVKEFRIDLGRYERTVDDEYIQRFTAESVIVHPSYNPYTFDSDIALIILKSPITVGFQVRPICYPQQQNSAFDEVYLSDGTTGTVVGFGKNEKGNLADILHMARLKVVGQQECADSFADTASGTFLTKSTTYCAGLKNGTNVCSGDSGGGMYFPIQQGIGPSRWYLQGLVSVGFTPEGERKCDPTRYSIFTRVSSYADWIVKILSESDAL